jgi:transposase
MQRKGSKSQSLNPKVANRFAQTIRRSKTDAADAEVLAEYARRMPFTAFFDSLLTRKKARLQALIAVARKLLHAIYGIFRSGLEYEGTKSFPRIKLS